MPPLRERKSDIPSLVGKFLQMASPGNKSITITSQALQALSAYHWPGNVRELKTAVELAVLECNFKEVDVQHLPAEVLGMEAKKPELSLSEVGPIEDLNLEKALKITELATIKKALERSKDLERGRWSF